MIKLVMVKTVEAPSAPSTYMRVTNLQNIITVVVVLARGLQKK